MDTASHYPNNFLEGIQIAHLPAVVITPGYNTIHIVRTHPQTVTQATVDSLSTGTCT
jgi:hypothetical protein